MGRMVRIMIDGMKDLEVRMGPFISVGRRGPQNAHRLEGHATFDHLVDPSRILNVCHRVCVENDHVRQLPT